MTALYAAFPLAPQQVFLNGVVTVGGVSNVSTTSTVQLTERDVFPSREDKKGSLGLKPIVGFINQPVNHPIMIHSYFVD